MTLRNSGAKKSTERKLRILLKITFQKLLEKDGGVSVGNFSVAFSQFSPKKFTL